MSKEKVVAAHVPSEVAPRHQEVSMRNKIMVLVALAIGVVPLVPTEVQAGPARKQPHELWRWVVLAALEFLLLEWPSDG